MNIRQSALQQCLKPRINRLMVSGIQYKDDSKTAVGILYKMPAAILLVMVQLDLHPALQIQHILQIKLHGSQGIDKNVGRQRSRIFRGTVRHEPDINTVKWCEKEG